MRTAITTAVTHDKKDVLVHGKSVPLLEQIQAFKTFRHGAATDGSHPEYAEVSFQESDGYAQVVRFNSPEKQKQINEQKKKDEAAYQASLKKTQAKESAKNAERGAGNAERESLLEAGKNRLVELNGLDRAGLLGVIEQLKAAGKPVDTGGKSTKSALVNGILKAEGFEVTAPETDS